jgi:lathosterol oxidase
MAGNGEDYEYKPRETVPMPERSFRLGDGKISGYLSVSLGVLSVLGVLCYRFPSYLTTAELRASYDADMLQQVLIWGMFTSLIFALLTFILASAAAWAPLVCFS